MQHKIAFFAAINHNYDHKQQALKNRHHGRTGRGGGGGEGGSSPPKILGNSDFLGSKRKFGQRMFLKTSSCLLNYFEDLNINLKSA